jgi:hypothetical protein
MTPSTAVLKHGNIFTGSRPSCAFIPGQQLVLIRTNYRSILSEVAAIIDAAWQLGVLLRFNSAEETDADLGGLRNLFQCDAVAYAVLDVRRKGVWFKGGHLLRSHQRT